MSLAQPFMQPSSEDITAEFLTCERRTLERVLPGLDQELAGLDLQVLEREGSPALPAFKHAGGVGLLIPHEHSGLGVGPVDAVRIQRALGSRCPSLAVATTMHHFSISSLVELSHSGSGFEWVLLQGIAEGQCLVASGFAEGHTGQSILAPRLLAKRSEGGYVISGSKKPCSLSASMDLLSASVTLVDEDDAIGVALIGADAEGVSRRPFWGSPILAGAESDEVVLTNVEVEEALMVRLDASTDHGTSLQTTGFLWFELLITASYLGVASALAERVVRSPSASAAVRAQVAGELEASMAAVEAVAHRVAAGDVSDAALTRALLVRYCAQDAIQRSTAVAVEALGGMAFIRSDDVAYLASAARALAFHPPSRMRTQDALADALLGRTLQLA